MTKEINVIKRNGTRELVDLEKIHRVLTWAAEGLKNVSVSTVELKSHIQFFDGMATSDIHETLIKTAGDLISPDTPDYDKFAGRLSAFAVRKEAYGQFSTPTLFEHIHKLVAIGRYDAQILDFYTVEEINELDKTIEHGRDLEIAYVGMNQMREKYLAMDRTTMVADESPQFLYMLVAMTLMHRYDYLGKEQRLDLVKRFYNATSTFKLSLPTPIMAGVRTPLRQFSSCVVIEAEDDLDSINATNASIVRYISQRAGIGFNFGAIRAVGSTIANGRAVSTGVTPYLKMFASAVKCCSQG